MSFVYARVLTLFQKLTETMGLSFEGLMQEADIDISLMAMDEATISADKYFCLQENILLQSGKEDFGLLVGRIFYKESFHLYMHLASSSNTLREWINILPSVPAVTGSVGRLNIRTERDNLILEAFVERKGVSKRCLFTDTFMASAVLLMDGFSLLPVRPIRVDFCYPEPIDTTALKDTFRAPLYFNRPINAIYYQKKILDLPLLHVSTQVYDSVREEANEFLFDFTWKSDSFTTGLYSVVRRKLPTGNYTLNQVARNMNMSVRTLQRRLQERGTSFQHFLQVVKSNVALKYLQDKSLSIIEVGMLLGYKDSTSFSAAFKSWYNCTPREFRRKPGEMLRKFKFS